MDKKLAKIKVQNDLLKQQYKEQTNNKSVNFLQFNAVKDKQFKELEKQLIKCRTESKPLHGTSKIRNPRKTVKQKLIESQIKTKKEKNTKLFEHVKELEKKLQQKRKAHRQY